MKAPAFTRALALFSLSLLLLQANGPLPSLASSLLAAQEKPGPGAVMLERLLRDISAKRSMAVAIQRELVARPALNPEDGGEGEEAKARWIESWLTERGLPEATRIDSPDERVPSKVRPNLIIVHPGASERTLWVLGHLDVSPPGPLSLWTGSPWALRMEGDTLYGRGVEDNHQAISSGLVLLESLNALRATPALSFGLVLSSAEKHGFPRQHGLEAVLKARPDIFRPGDLIVVNDYGDGRGGVVEVAEKGLLWLKITVTGKQAHASAPQLGRNALEAGADLIADLRALKTQFSRTDALFTPPGSSFTVSSPEKTDSPVNQIPGKFVFHMDCRLLPLYTPEEVLAAARALAASVEARHRVLVEFERIASIPAFPGTAPDAPVVLALRRAVLAQLGVEALPVGIGGVTLAADLRARGLPVAVWAKAESVGQNVDESVSVSDILNTAKVFARILFDPETTKGETP